MRHHMVSYTSRGYSESCRKMRNLFLGRTDRKRFAREAGRLRPGTNQDRLSHQLRDLNGLLGQFPLTANRYGAKVREVPKPERQRASRNREEPYKLNIVSRGYRTGEPRRVK